MRAGISTLLVVAAVAVVVAGADESRGGGAATSALDSRFVAVPTLTLPVTAPVVVAVAPPSPAPPTTAGAVEPVVATTAFVPTTARPTTPPTTEVTIDLRPGATCWVTSAVRPGSSGDDVRCVQRRLRQIMSGGLGSDADGRFGPGTEIAVRRFQQASGLSVDGVVGASTARILGIWQDEPPNP